MQSEMDSECTLGTCSFLGRESKEGVRLPLVSGQRARSLFGRSFFRLISIPRS